MINKELLEDWSDADNDEDLGDALARHMMLLIEAHKTRLTKIYKALSSYDNVGYGSLFDAVAGRPADGWSDEQALTFNGLNSSLDTLLSKIGKNKILPRVVTTNAKWSKRDQASRIEKYVRGLFKQLKVEEKMERALFSTLLHGDGFIKVVNCNGEITVEPVLADEIYVDFIDGLYGSPTKMYQTRIKDVKSVMADFPEYAEEIDILWQATPDALQLGESTLAYTANKVVLVEAWSLQQGECAGRHVIACGSKILLDEEWDRPYFPFIHMQYQKPERGYYTKGMYHALAPLQREIDFTFRMVSEAQRLCGSPKVILRTQKGGDPVTVKTESQVTNKVAEVLVLEGGEDFQIYSPPALNSERFAYLNQLKQLEYEQVGVSQLSATSRLPIGIDGASGKALREYSDIETERFALLAQEWERAHSDLGVLLIHEVSRTPEFLVRSYDRTSPLEEIRFSDLNICIDDVVIAVYPASSLPSRPEARFAQVQEWIQSGFIDKQSAMELMDIPDLDAYAEINNAPKKAVDKVIDLILEHRIKRSVEPFMDLKYLVKQATFYYNHVLAEWNPRKRKTEVVLDLLRQLIEDANYQIEQLKPKQPTTTPTAGLPIAGTPDMTGLAAGSGTPLPPEVAAPPLPPDAAALLGGV